MSRVRPAMTADNEFFWRAGHDGVLRILGCSSCEFLIHPPAPHCPRCGGSQTAPRDVSGRATVYSYTVVPGPAPVVIAIVELAEQAELRLMTNIVDCPADSVRIGQSVEVTFEPSDDLMIPLFRPVEAA